ncbi:MAG: HPP family protein [PVC group bacterium]|nr:HPP family protein [PVC group bacterium]
MQFIDKKFKYNKRSYIIQSLLATLSIFIVLLLLDAKTNAAIIASLGASSFIAFTVPHASNSGPRFLIGGYTVGILSGGICHYLSLLACLQNIPIINELSYIFFASLAVGLAIFIMVITNTEHPPAAGLALGLVFNAFNHRTLLVVILGIIALSLIKTLLKPLLKNLL